MLEARVHDQLREFLRACVTSPWAHHLTMARIVSRALRLQRSALIQTGSSSHRYCLSYLLPIFLSDSPVLLVTTPTIQSHLLDKEIPRLQGMVNGRKCRLPDLNHPSALVGRLSIIGKAVSPRDSHIY